MRNKRKLKAQRRTPPVHELSPETSAILDRVMDADRAYFEQHPEATSYIRPAVSGEFPAAIHGAYVTVVQIEPGVRMRRVWVP